MHLFRFLLFIIWLAPVSLVAQKVHVSAYTTANGLPSNHIQDVIQDTFGYLWITTDAGLVRFDGVSFQTFSKEIPSKYVKRLLQTESGVYFSHDAGLSFYRPSLDSLVFELLLENSGVEEDSKLYYPNQLYRQANGAIWISQPNGKIACFENGAIQSFDLGKLATTGRSDAKFIFVESQTGHLWAAAQSGKLYLFDPANQEFTEQFSFGFINDMILLEGDLWLAGQGLQRIKLNESGNRIISTQKYKSVNDTISAIANDQSGNVYLALRRKGLFLLDREEGRGARLRKIFSNNDPHRVDELPFKNINRIKCLGQKILICADEGFGVLQKRFFESVDALTNGNTIGMAEASDGNIFINFGDIFKIEPRKFGYEARQLPSLRLGAISFVTAAKNMLWAGTTNGELLQLSQEGLLLKSIDLSWRGESVFSIVYDQNQQTWFCQAPTEKPVIGVGCVQKNGSIKYYDKQHGFSNRVLVIKEGPSGRIYAAGIGHSSYLYRYLPDEDTFLNLSLPVDFQLSPNFEVHDITIDAKGLVWMGTTDGLLVFDTDRVRRVDLGLKYKDVEIRAVASMPGGIIWASTDTEGLLFLRDGDILEIGEKSGLPSKIMAYRSLLIDSNNRLWAGTAEGIVYSYEQNPQPIATPRPLLLSVAIDGAQQALKNLQLSTKQQIEVRFNTPAFHGYRLFYEYQLDQGNWMEIGTTNTLNLKNLEPGVHNLKIKARKEGGFSWSQALLIPFEVIKPWYQHSIWRVLSIAFLLLGIALIFRLTRKYYHKKINILTKELQSTRREAFEQEASLEQIQKELNTDESELRIAAITLALLSRLIRKMPPGTKWDSVMEHLSTDLMKIPGVVAFEIARKHGQTIEFEGYSQRTKSFTVSAKANNPKTCLAAYCIHKRKSIVLGDISSQSRTLLKQPDERIEIYKSVVGVPFYLQENQKAILFLYADEKDYFDQYNLRTLGVLCAYLEQIS